MDQIFDRLGNLLRSLFQDDDEPRSESHRSSSADPDVDAAWEELDEFLKSGKNTESSQRSQEYRSRTASGSTRTGGGRMPEEVRKDYANLEVDVGADMATVQKAYHRLIRQYHPDRFASDPKKFTDATEITQRINQSYQRIKRYKETGKV